MIDQNPDLPPDLNDHAAPESPDQSDNKTLGSNKRFNIPGDVVNLVTAGLPAEDREALRWLHRYGFDSNIPYKDLAALLKRPDGTPYDGNTLYKVLTGKHEAKLTNFVKAILDLKKLVEARASITRIGFIKTKLAEDIFGICNAALRYQRPSLIFGETQIGKTEALQQFAKDHNHGQTIYVRMPAGGKYRKFIARLAEAVRISPQAENLEQRIIRAFDSQMLLIVDEAHQGFIGYAKEVRTIEFIREIWDMSKCGAVICATDVLDQEFQRGTLKGVLSQMSQRRILTLRLPPKPSRKDLNIFAAAYGLDPASGEALQLQTEVIRDSGLGRWCTVLQAASHLSNKRKQTLAWEHVIKANAGFLKLENPDKE